MISCWHGFAIGSIDAGFAARKLRVKHRDQMRFGFQAARIAVGTVFLDSRSTTLHGIASEACENDILVLHGFDPFVSR